MRNFKELLIWQKGIEIVRISYQISKQLPSEEKFGLVSQLIRAAVSIPSNIAEGSSRSSTKEYKHYLEIALGSTFEVETLTIIIRDLFNEITITDRLIEMIIEEQKMLSSFISKLKSLNS